jgi:5-methylthioadenosine/S-adenosylhomocysteine deaminase
MRTLISDAIVVTNDDARSVLMDGAVVIGDDRIVAVGTSQDLKREYQSVDRVIDGRGKLIMPGFVSAHTHAGYTVFRGRVEDGGLDTFLTQLMPMAGVMTPAERLTIGCLTYFELLKSGVTTLVQVEEEAEGFPEFAEKIGIRSFVGVQVQDVEPAQVLDGTFAADAGVRQQQLAKAIGFAEKLIGRSDRVTPIFMVNSPMTSSPELLKGLRSAADRLGIRLTLHLGLGARESEVTERLHGKSSFAYVRDFGLLGPDVIACHSFHIPPQDMDILAASRTHIAHCPQINAIRGSIAPVQALQDRGLNVALGIDNYFADFFEVLRSAVSVARIKTQDGTALQPSEVLRMATVNGAMALGLTDVGKIEKGYKADLAILDCTYPGLTPLFEPAPSVVYHAHMGSVDTVIADGRIVVEGGLVKNVGYEELRQQAALAANSAWSRFISRYGGTKASLNKPGGCACHRQ